ncbi:MAG: energy-coupling factor ABC transporter permease [Thermoplasmata archaeon]
MHIPDGLMDPLVAGVGWVEFATVAAVALYMSGRKVREKDLPRIAVLCAGIFVAQMLNFPIGGGTTGHLIGGALFAILVGPVIAIIGMTIILLIQALMFGDGGLTAFGLNAVNMAVIAPLMGWGVYTMLKPLLSRGGAPAGKTFVSGEAIAIGVGAWASVFVASAACAAELAVSYAISGGAYGIAAAVSVPAMLGYHAVIGVGEAIITVGVAAYVLRIAPEMFKAAGTRAAPLPGLRNIMTSRIAQATVAIMIVFALALPLYFMYSSEGADGLEKTMEDAQVGEGEPLVASPFSYGEDYFTALFAGILGFVTVALLGLGVLKVLSIWKTAD